MALKIVLQDYASPFTEHLQKYNLAPIRNRNIQLLATELFTVKYGGCLHVLWTKSLWTMHSTVMT